MNLINPETKSLYYLVNVEAVIVKDDHYLMITRSLAESHAPGVITLPGGKVEDAGQTDHILEQTLRRGIEGNEIQAMFPATPATGTAPSPTTSPVCLDTGSV